MMELPRRVMCYDAEYSDDGPAVDCEKVKKWAEDLLQSIEGKNEPEQLAVLVGEIKGLISHLS